MVTSVHCLHYITVESNTGQRSACSALVCSYAQCFPELSGVVQWCAVACSVVHYYAVICSVGVLQCFAVLCSVMQFYKVFCSVVQC